jgi:hypothetical protein
MIILEVLGEVFVRIIFEGVILKGIRFITKCFKKLFSKNTKLTDPKEILEKKFLYKKIELVENLNSVLKSGQKGSVLEIINKDKIYAEFYDDNGSQIELDNESVFEISIDQFKLTPLPNHNRKLWLF